MVNAKTNREKLKQLKASAKEVLSLEEHNESLELRAGEGVLELEGKLEKPILQDIKPKDEIR